MSLYEYTDLLTSNNIKRQEKKKGKRKTAIVCTNDFIDTDIFLRPAFQEKNKKPENPPNLSCIKGQANSQKSFLPQSVTTFAQSLSYQAACLKGAQFSSFTSLAHLWNSVELCKMRQGG